MMTFNQSVSILVQCVEHVKPNLSATEAIHKEINEALVVAHEFIDKEVSIVDPTPSPVSPGAVVPA